MAQMWEFSKALYLLGDFTKVIAINLINRLMWPRVFVSSLTSPHVFSYFYVSWVRNVRKVLT